MHEGLTLAIVGRPNVGKSSLFNRLVERERAIVTATPGTTRDLVSETVAIGGIPVRLVDTAGIRAALDEAESIGVRKSMEALAEADVVLVVLDRHPADTTIPVPMRAADSDDQGRAAILVQQSRSRAGAAPRRAAPGSRGTPALPSDWVATSALTGEGIAELRDEDPAAGRRRRRVSRRAVSSPTSASSSLWRTRSPRSTSGAAVPQKIPHEMLLLDLYNALRPLDDITGATTADDILNLIFSSFCIGK